jgi:hypothetical protein
MTVRVFDQFPTIFNPPVASLSGTVSDFQDRGKPKPSPGSLTAPDECDLLCHSREILSKCTVCTYRARAVKQTLMQTTDCIDINQRQRTGLESLSLRHSLLDSALFRLLDWNPLAFSGTISCSIYVWQQPVYVRGFRSMQPRAALFGLFSIAFISYFSKSTTHGDHLTEPNFCFPNGDPLRRRAR